MIVYVLLVLFIVAGPNSEIPTDYALATRGGRTSATIIETTCANHDTVSFLFRTVGEQYVGHGQVSNCTRLHAGDHVDAWFLSDRPAINTLAPGLQGDIAMALLLPLIIVLGLARWLRSTTKT
jgi:hypothetical protein